MVEFFGWVSGIGTGLMNIIYYALYSLPVIVILLWFIIWIRNKRIYTYKVRIFRIREGQRHKEFNFKGGYVNRKNSAPFFRIKTGWVKHIDLITTPNPEYIDEEERIYYKQIDVNTFVQLKRHFDKGLMTITPVDSDVKYGAILSIQRIKEILRTEPLWKKVLPYASLIILGIIFIVSYAMLMNNCSG